MYKNFILFKTRIPHELLINGGLELRFHEAITNIMKGYERRYHVLAEKHYVESQYVPAESSSFSKIDIVPGPKELAISFSYMITKMQLIVEVFDEEIPTIEKLSPEESSIVFQNLMLSFSRYYNELMKGNDFFKPMVYGFGPQVFSLKTEFGKKELAAHIAGSFSIRRNYKKDITSQELKIANHYPWRYYYYKAIDCFDICEYLDSIIWCAISIETYVMHLITEKGLASQLSRLKGSKGSYSFFDEVKILKESGIITQTQGKRLAKLFSRMKDYRNEIVHGDIDSTFYSLGRASNSIELLTNYYKQYEGDLV